jgi:hypothetical protein
LVAARASLLNVSRSSAFGVVEHPLAPRIATVMSMYVAKPANQ